MIAALTVILGPLAESAKSQCSYEVSAILEAPVNCGILGPANTFATAINDNGMVTGYYTCLSLRHPFMWSEKTGFFLIPLPPGVSDATPADINNHSEIVGVMNQYSTGDRAFHYKGNMWTELPMLPDSTQSRAHAINDNGDIVGDSLNGTTGPQFAVMWRNGEIDTITLPIGPHGSGVDIADVSSVVGWMGGSGNPIVGYLSHDGKLVEIPPVSGGSSSRPMAVNNHTVTAGQSQLPVKSGPVPIRSWVFNDGKLTDLGTLPTINHRALAEDINDAEQIIGTATNPDSSSAPFLWQHGVIHDMRLLVVDAPQNLILQSASGMNQRGQVIGGALFESRTVAVVLTPKDVPIWGHEL